MKFRERGKLRSAGLLLRLLRTFLIILSIPIVLELFACILAKTTGLDARFHKGSTTISEIAAAYRLKVTSPQGHLYSVNSPFGELLAIRSPLLGYTLAPEQKNDYWTINRNGFRDIDPLPARKDQEEIRVAILGGSAAFGQLSSNNTTTVAERLEAKLNARVAQQQRTPQDFQPEMLPFFADRVSEVLSLPPRIREGTYRVINAAVPGYSSGNELALFVQQLSAYDLDVVIVLNGYADLFLPGDLPSADVPGIDTLAALSEASLRDRVIRVVKQWFGNLMLVRSFQYYILSPVDNTQDVDPLSLNIMGVEPFESLADGLPHDEAELQRRLDRYRHHLVQMVRFSMGLKSPLILAVQPEITGRNVRVNPPEEQVILDRVGKRYQEQISQIFPLLVSLAGEVASLSPQVDVIDLYSAFNGGQEHWFQTPTNLTDEGNEKLADILFDRVLASVTVFPTPFDPNHALTR